MYTCLIYFLNKHIIKNKKYSYASNNLTLQIQVIQIIVPDFLMREHFNAINLVLFSAAKCASAEECVWTQLQMYFQISKTFSILRKTKPQRLSSRKKDTSSYGCISVYEQIVMYATT